MWNKREEKAGYYVYPAFFAPGEERKEKYDIFCKKRVDIPWAIGYNKRALKDSGKKLKMRE